MTDCGGVGENRQRQTVQMRRFSLRWHDKQEQVQSKYNGKNKSKSKSDGTALADDGLLGGWGGGVWFLLHEEHVGGDAEGNALFLEGEDDAAAQFAEDWVALIGADANVDGIDDFATVDLVYAENVGIGDGDVFEGRVAADLVGESAEEGHDSIGVGAGVDADGE